MIFKFPQKKIVLDCLISDKLILETAPILPAIKIIPEWWRNLPSSYLTFDGFSPAPTMKHCTGMVDYYKKSIAIPLWSDLIIKIDEDKNYRWQFSDRTSTAVHHQTELQATNFLDGYGHIKLESPWVLKCKEDINWVWSHPTYSYSFGIDIISFPGITNFYHQYSTNINIMFYRDQPKKIFLPQGSPMALITPMSDRKVEVVKHLVDEREIINSKNKQITFLGKHGNIIKRKKEFSDCPFHDHTKGK